MNIFLILGFFVGLFGGYVCYELHKVFSYWRCQYKQYKKRKMKEQAAKDMHNLIQLLGGDKWITNVESEHMYSLAPLGNKQPILKMQTTLTNKK